MSVYLLWWIAGFLLIISELLTGSFYLLVLGGGAFAGGAIAYFGGAFWPQVMVAGGIAILGTYLVHRWRARLQTGGNVSIDAGQMVQFESWVDQAARVARVRYRGTLWDAQVAPESDPSTGDILFIHSNEGNSFHVSSVKPAR